MHYRGTEARVYDFYGNESSSEIPSAASNQEKSWETASESPWGNHIGLLSRAADHWIQFSIHVFVEESKDKNVNTIIMLCAPLLLLI